MTTQSRTTMPQPIFGHGTIVMLLIVHLLIG
jgi:hypothetical protein